MHSYGGMVCLFLVGNLGSTSELDISDADYCFIGEYASDYAGQSISSAGDVDGDGFADILIGSRENDDGGNRAGKAYLILASSLGSSTTIDLADADYAFVGESASDYAGQSVSSAGDVDGDGLVDLAVGAYGSWYSDGGSGRGQVYVLFLNADGTVKAEQKISSTTGGLVGPLHNFDRFGYSVGSLGDLDGDGVTCALQVGQALAP